MNPLKIFAWPVGTWPLQEHSLFSTSRTILSIAILVTMLTIMNVEIWLDLNDAEKNLEAVMLIGCGFLAVSKVIWFRFNPYGLVTNFSSASKDYKELSGVEKRAIMRHHAYMSRVTCLGVLGFSFAAMTFMSIASVLDEDDTTMDQGNKFEDNTTQKEPIKYPFPSELTMKTLNIPEDFYPLILFAENIMLILTATGNLGSDNVFFGIAFHLCGQAEILKMEYSRFIDESENIIHRFHVLISRHYQLLKLFKELNDTISTILVIQLLTSYLLICLTGFQFILSLSVRNMVMMMKTFIEMFIVMSQLFAYSYVGEYLKNQMKDIGYAAYRSSWYNIPSYLSRNIVFILRRAQDPVQLRAQHFFVVNMETYMNIVKTSMSYLSVLRVMITT
ncbi:putative odorant receptor 85d [Colletes gigas]|uniref:putative odorant receptor 85d n=1 Tax=Colletes gigas TaxID=935657 RepID=UPI001C9AD3AD|nr:putative odorant receptor 85d [Colletes gigas]